VATCNIVTTCGDEGRLMSRTADYFCGPRGFMGIASMNIAVRQRDLIMARQRKEKRGLTT
jgi:hypothetical protein